MKQKKRNTPIDRARQNPKSRALALRAYYYDWVGCTQNTPTADMRREYRLLYKDAQTKGLVAAVKEACLDCVGADADPGPKLRVRDCEFTDCPLYSVRPYQKITGRKSS